MLLAELKRCARLKSGIAERFLDQALTIVEGAVDAQRRHIVAPAGQLLLLPRAHQSLRDKGSPPSPRDACEMPRPPRLRYPPRSRPGWSAAARGADLQPLQALRQKTRAEVLECRGRAVKKLERKQRIAGSRPPRVVGAGKVERRRRDLAERVAASRSPAKNPSSAARAMSGKPRYGRRRLRASTVGSRVGTYRPPSGARPCGDGFAQAHRRRAAARAREPQIRHQAFTTRAP